MAAHDDHRVIIKNLAFNLANSKGMSRLFQSHGFQGVRPEKVYINRKGMISNTPGQMCVAFVTLSNEKEVEAAIRTFHGKTLQGLSDKPVCPEGSPKIVYFKVFLFYSWDWISSSLFGWRCRPGYFTTRWVEMVSGRNLYGPNKLEKG